MTTLTAEVSRLLSDWRRRALRESPNGKCWSELPALWPLGRYPGLRHLRRLITHLHMMGGEERGSELAILTEPPHL